jgi:hypothetical protein
VTVDQLVALIGYGVEIDTQFLAWTRKELEDHLEALRKTVGDNKPHFYSYTFSLPNGETLTVSGFTPDQARNNALAAAIQHGVMQFNVRT